MNTENIGGWGSRSDIHPLARMALPFVPALTWALALAVVFMPSTVTKEEAS